MKTMPSINVLAKIWFVDADVETAMRCDTQEVIDVSDMSSEELVEKLANNELTLSVEELTDTSMEIRCEIIDADKETESYSNKREIFSKNNGEERATKDAF